jgi:hypothetical protein
MLDWHAFDRAIEAGYRDTVARIDEIKAAILIERRAVPTNT